MAFTSFMVETDRSGTIYSVVWVSQLLGLVRLSGTWKLDISTKKAPFFYFYFFLFLFFCFFSFVFSCWASCVSGKRLVRSLDFYIQHFIICFCYCIGLFPVQPCIWQWRVMKRTHLTAFNKSRCP
ncbi:hypothetical protein V8F33_005119 [Rhypophila sp. PSN 637]